MQADGRRRVVADVELYAEALMTRWQQVLHRRQRGRLDQVDHHRGRQHRDAPRADARGRVLGPHRHLGGPRQARMDGGKVERGHQTTLKFFGIPIGLGILRVHRLQRLAHDRRNRRVARPLAVGRDHVPGRPRGRASVEHRSRRRPGSRPRACAPPGRADRISSACRPRPARSCSRSRLLLLRDMQHELEDRGAVLGQHLLERVDLLVARLDLILGGASLRTRTTSTSS